MSIKASSAHVHAPDDKIGGRNLSHHVWVYRASNERHVVHRADEHSAAPQELRGKFEKSYLPTWYFLRGELGIQGKIFTQVVLVETS